MFTCVVLYSIYILYKTCCYVYLFLFLDPHVEYSVFYSTVTYLFRLTLI